MKIIAIISQKGGAAKTTLATHLAVEAIRDGKNAAIVDLDPQVSAAKWKDIRKSSTPIVLSAQAARLKEVFAQAQEAQVDLLFLDTAPHSDSIAIAAARSADFILIPTKCSMFDFQAVPNSVDIAVSVAKKPAAIVLCEVPIRGATVEQVREGLETLGVEICPYTTGDRAAYRNAIAVGLTAQEYEPHGKAAEEIKQIYTWVYNKVA
jgi:chromosome partitioning protein